MTTEGESINNEIREKIMELEEQHDVSLSTIQKILLTIEGQIVTILDVLYGNVKLFIIDQCMIKADKQTAEKLDVSEGDEIDLREVIVHKKGHPLVYAKSYIPKDRCSDRVIDELFKEESTTSRIMLAHEIETTRKIKEISIEKPTALLRELFNTTEDMLSREYVMIHKKKVVIWTKELYPLSHFKE
ncbi:chorismate pyruvate-lyase family protein [Methanobrevibacter sp.]|uniref:chorismate pyruvate-lyase family protein n=1 Tax=Methanobrevibacter sp. TaxID=66852 RepID=UPI0026E04AD9|nr:chorismate pyruvate-lyase family protein [Methanobrevibacter sp.]MDO5859276.1 chorismate pyruvate-lyase family protein [Methanobrevibacter sp.]